MWIRDDDMQRYNNIYQRKDRTTMDFWTRILELRDKTATILSIKLYQKTPQKTPLMPVNRIIKRFRKYIDIV